MTYPSNNLSPWLVTLFMLFALSACSTAPVDSDLRPVASAVVRNDIVKSPNDTREYRYLELGNGLKVLLVSDEKADKSAAALTVFRGSFDDPIERPGLAHFLEHMLFIGTEKYPEPDGYFSYVQSHGGSSNAYTASEHTNYFFDVQPEAFREGLDRFAHFFISPLFQKEYVEREKNAVNSEYKMQIKEDGWRGFVVQKQVLNPDHPASRFNIGTLDTLDGDVHGALLTFFDDHYSANEMGLVVLAKEPLDELQPWVVELFSQIRNRNLSNIEREMPLLLEGQLPATMQHDNLKETYGLSYTWPIPPIGDLYRKKPVQYLSNLIGHEGDGSLHKLLNDLGWINSLGAGESVIDDNAAVLSVNLDLTEAGAGHVPEINAYVFAYLDMLRNSDIEQWIYDEQAAVSELGFRFAEKSSAMGVVRTLAPNLEHIPAEDLLVAPYMMEEFDGEMIRDFLGYMTPENVFVAVSSPGYSGSQSEKWFGVSYDLDQGDIETAEVESTRLKLPEPNPFLPESLGLVSADEDLPLPVIQRDDVEVYVDTDVEFRVPRAVTHVSLRNPGGLVALEDAAIAQLYATLVQDDLNALAYPALLAGVSYQIASPPRGFRVSIGGYEDKQFVLLNEVMLRLINLDIDADRFDTLKQEMLKNLSNAAKNRPFRQAYQRVQDTLVNSGWTAEEQIPVIEGLSLVALVQWRDAIFKDVSLQALIHGNVEDEKAAALVELVKQHVSLTGVEVGEPLVATVSGVMEVDLAVDHADAVLALYVQNETASIEERAKSALLTHLVSPGYFSTLRTEQQLGYVVSAIHSVFFERGGMTFLVQSPVVGPAEIRQRTLAFLDTEVERLAGMSAEEYGVNKGGLIARLTQRDKNLSQRAGRYWSDLDRGVTTFDANMQLAKAVSALELPDVQRFLGEVRARLNANYLQVYSNGKFE